LCRRTAIDPKNPTISNPNPERSAHQKQRKRRLVWSFVWLKRRHCHRLLFWALSGGFTFINSPGSCRKKGQVSGRVMYASK